MEKEHGKYYIMQGYIGVYYADLGCYLSIFAPSLCLGAFV